jgi:NAD(P)-dependent dehydrogenase (short-subunit alcohol dehydrogenase family)
MRAVRPIFTLSKDRKDGKDRKVWKGRHLMNRVALITGGSRGLGRTVADFLAAQSFDLVITSRGEAELETAARELRRHGGQVIALAGDVSDAAHRVRLARAAQDLGGLDLLFNNASTLGATPLPSLAEYPPGELEEAFRVNVAAPIALVREALPLLAQSGGLAVNISSDAARGGYPGWGGYGLTKAALDLASLTLANELRERGVGIVAVDPGDLRTRMHQEAFPGEDISDRPLPEVTLPFWAWLFGQPRAAVTGRRYRAQEDRWEVNATQPALAEVAV